MKVLIVGGGGREHALAWKCAQSPRVSQVLVAPGNAGTEAEPRVRNVDIAATDIPRLVQLAHREAIELTIIGPEAPLVAGIVDAFQDAGLRCFGPKRLAARLEGSKAFTKDFLQRHRIPTAAYRVFTRANYDRAWLRAQRAPIVVKRTASMCCRWPPRRTTSGWPMVTPVPTPAAWALIRRPRWSAARSTNG